MWLVMMRKDWSDLEVASFGLSVKAGPGMPDAWMPLFKDRAEAEAWAAASNAAVVEVADGVAHIAAATVETEKP